MEIELNKIYNMDCLEGLKNIKDSSVDIVLTDPPYGINFVPQRDNSRKKHHDIPIANDELTGENWSNWFLPITKEIYRVLKQDSVAYFYSGFSPYYYYYYNVLIKSGFDIKANIIWIKNNFGLGYHFRRQYEQVLVSFKGNPPVPKKAIPDVIFDKKINGFTLKHSCQKPEQINRILLKQYSKENDIVLDPFMGSGTTAVVAKQLNRNFIGFELEKKYINICNKRLAQKTLSESLVSYIDQE